ncbi:MAG: thioredoxin [Candidatus Aminicenantes bacterium]|nr:thioredoxin [Candidatus Aminicenantes bacterium]
MAEDIVSVSDDTFEEEVLKAELPVLVDFWAVWCAPCHAIMPALESLSQNYKEKMKVVKLNVDENMKTPSKYGITSIPTLLFFKEGELKETLVGVHSQDKIKKSVEKHL